MKKFLSLFLAFVVVSGVFGCGGGGGGSPVPPTSFTLKDVNPGDYFTYSSVPNALTLNTQITSFTILHPTSGKVCKIYLSTITAPDLPATYLYEAYALDSYGYWHCGSSGPFESYPPPPTSVNWSFNNPIKKELSNPLVLNQGWWDGTATQTPIATITFQVPDFGSVTVVDIRSSPYQWESNVICTDETYIYPEVPLPVVHRQTCSDGFTITVTLTDTNR